jgi:hypothetical protein
VKNNAFTFVKRAARSTSFLDRTVAARRPVKPDASTTGIIPGNRGKVGDSWCHPPLQDRASGKGRQISPAPLAGVVSGQFTHESGAERQGAIRNRTRAESGLRTVSIRKPTQLPRGLWLLLRRPERSRVSRRVHPAKRPGPQKRAGRVKETRRRGENGPGKVRQPPQIGAA